MSKIVYCTVKIICICTYVYYVWPIAVGLRTYAKLGAKLGVLFGRHWRGCWRIAVFLTFLSIWLGPLYFSAYRILSAISLS